MKRWIVIAIVFSALIVLTGIFGSCGGGGGSDGGGLANLEGTWVGWIEDDQGNIEEFSLQVDGSGNVTEVKINGISTGDTGHINEDWDENLFHVLYNIGSPLSHGIMIVDPQYSYATYGDWGAFGFSDYYYGVMEKGAAGMPAYAASDIVGNYPVGGAYDFNDGNGSWEGDDITMTVNPDLTFSSTQPDFISGGFDPLLFDSNHGRYAGTLTLTAGTMDITAYISSDGTAMAGFVKDANTIPTSLEDFVLIGLKK